MKDFKRGETVKVYDQEDKVVDATYDGVDTIIKGFRVHRVHILQKGEKVAAKVSAGPSRGSGKQRFKTLKKEGWRTWYLPDSRFVVK
jgi:hypothetical protein